MIAITRDADSTGIHHYSLAKKRDETLLSSILDGQSLEKLSRNTVDPASPIITLRVFGLRNPELPLPLLSSIRGRSPVFELMKIQEKL